MKIYMILDLRAAGFREKEGERSTKEGKGKARSEFYGFPTSFWAIIHFKTVKGEHVATIGSRDGSAALSPTKKGSCSISHPACALVQS